MSKKKFTNGLESLFDDIHEEESVSTSVLEEQQPEQKEIGIKKIGAKKGGKNFSSDLNNIIENSLTVVKNIEEKDDKLNNYAHVKRQQKPLSGLEALLSRTIDYNDLDDNSKKRIVLILEQAKVDKLKDIAKIEQLFLKDILLKSVAFYIDQHEKKRKN